MDERLRRAAQSGDIEALYASIEDDADLFRHIDQMKFVDTPLHIAAAAGHTDFAMEMMNLNPSFARKLNRGGFSPIHLALQNQKNELVVDLVSIDKDLVRVKGREGYTPLHVVARDGNVPLLSQFLNDCPDCLFDLTIRKETALHIAARNNRLEAFEAMVRWIKKNLKYSHFQKRRILNLQDKDGNTVLHIAASNNQAQIIKLLIKCEEVDRKITNGGGLTALDVLLQQTQIDSRESVNILQSHRRFFEVSSFNIKLAHDIEDMKPETINALLVVFALILSMTYQALLSPPGSVFQGDASSNSTTNQNVGKSVMNSIEFLWFYLSNGVAFFLAWFITISLLLVVAKSIISLVLLLYVMMSLCYAAALGVIAPLGLTGGVAGFLPSMLVAIGYYFALYRFKKQ